MDQFSASLPPPRPARAPSNLPWLISLLVFVLVFLFAPFLLERLSYSWTRGRERAEVDVARTQLPGPALAQLSREFALVAKAIGPSVVHIDTEQIVNGNGPGDEWSHYFGGQGQQRTQGQGSGVIVDEEGYILTNFHVVENTRDIQVRLSNGETRAGTVVGLDPVTDLALVKISSGGLVAAQWGDSDALAVGGLVWAVGNPFGLDRSVTFGIISAKSRRGLGNSPYQDFLQTDAAVNPGNSGGPLVDGEGKIVGINTAIVGRAYQGVSFSIPSVIAKEVYDRLRSSGKVERAWLGVKLADLTPELAKKLEIKELAGAVVQQVVAAAPAAKAGIQPGDVIVEWNGHPVGDATELTLLVGKSKIGSTAKATLLRDGARITLEVQVEERPADLTR